MTKFTVTPLSLHEKYKILPWLICGIGAAFYFYEYFLRIAPSVMTSDLRSAFHLNAAGYGSLVAFYYFAYTPMQLIVGVLMDRYGPRRLLMLACSSCVIGAFLFASSHSLALAQVSRFLIGFGSAFAFVGTLKLATIWLPPERFAAISGLVTSLGMLGAIVGDVFLSKFVHMQGWRSATYFSAWVGIILVILIFFVVHDNVKTSRKERPIPEIEFKELFIGLGQSLKNRYIWIAGLIGCFLYLPISAFAELWGVPYLKQAHHLSSTQAATVISMIFLGWAIGSPLTGWLSDFIRRRRLPVMVGAFLSIFLICAIIFIPHLSLLSLYVLFFTFGLTTSVEVIVFAIGREVSSRRIAGTAIALTNAFVMFSGVLFQPIIGMLLDLHWHGQMAGGIRIYSAQNYQFALSVLPIGLLMCFILGFFVKETHCHVE